MAIQRRNMQTTAKQARRKKQEVATGPEEPAKEPQKTQKELVEEHLPPLPLVFVILFCSGALLVLALRDFLTTGRNIGGTWDEAMMLFTKSTDWFEDAKGWRSTQGGFSVVMPVTTDENNMGGFFVRKLAGAASVGVHLQKLMPMLMHPMGAQWILGHFRPLLNVALLGNLAIAAFYGTYLSDLDAAGASEMPRAILALLALESFTILFYLKTSKVRKSNESIAMPEGKRPNSYTSNIVTRTVAIVTTAVSLIALRDLALPGRTIPLLPRDDIYLEWTGAFFHSPPENSPEALDQGLQAPFYIGDRFISQYAALHVLILSAYKFATAFYIRYGKDGSGEAKCKMIWKSQVISCGLIVFTFRMFQPSANSASLDLRWHLMCLAYEWFILGLYAYF